VESGKACVSCRDGNRHVQAPVPPCPRARGHSELAWSFRACPDRQRKHLPRGINPASSSARIHWQDRAQTLSSRRAPACAAAAQAGPRMAAIVGIQPTEARAGAKRKGGCAWHAGEGHVRHRAHQGAGEYARRRRAPRRRAYSPHIKKKRTSAETARKHSRQNGGTKGLPEVGRGRGR
jgi:hypothetical protein